MVLPNEQLWLLMFEDNDDKFNAFSKVLAQVNIVVVRFKDYEEFLETITAEDQLLFLECPIILLDNDLGQNKVDGNVIAFELKQVLGYKGTIVGISNDPEEPERLDWYIPGGYPRYYFSQEMFIKEIEAFKRDILALYT